MHSLSMVPVNGCVHKLFYLAIASNSKPIARLHKARKLPSQRHETRETHFHGCTGSRSGYLTHKTGHEAVLTTFSAVLPKSA
ncbi:MAG: hypothetical protein BROFUL_02479 [Candidatus Brocadia fulgida]|uniref:Uncharacterized protein n=1 Tax=Candidatus Brocadia fulgida TaxID=380242 RepID=A0A0M2URX0_9BACT|nr:MAG: hypothetical protein BROFUL_02479 [Candidatus Brocadia fulgida]MBV6517621.1 hypothetical protein [Candidatus Brocadia fulgida]